MHVPINHDHAMLAGSHLAASHPSARMTLHGRRILVLDDDPLAAVIASLDLEDAGAPFVLVHDEASANAALDQAMADGRPFDAAVLDVNLGNGRTSRSVAERLRAKGVPFVLHTADPDALRTSADTWTPADGSAPIVLAKPAPAGALAQVLTRLMPGSD